MTDDQTHEWHMLTLERRIGAIEEGVKSIENSVRAQEVREELRYQTQVIDIGVKKMEKFRTRLIFVIAIGVPAVVAACLYG